MYLNTEKEPKLESRMQGRAELHSTNLTCASRGGALPMGCQQLLWVQVPK